MARIRSIHPGITSDEAFMQMSMTAKAAWPLLWMECDDHGVFEWKPIVLKARIFPADNVDFDGILSEFEGLNCVMRFEHEGKRYGAVRNFCAYQKPKSPSFRHPCPVEVAKYTCAKDFDSATTTPGLPQPYTSTTENSSQMEEGGGSRRGNMKEAASAASAGAAENPAAPIRDRAWMEALEAKLRAAAGLESDPSPNLVVVGPIVGMIDAGADLEADILPVIRAKSKAGAKPRSWSFFIGAIQDAMKARHAAGEHAPKPPAPPDETPEQTRKRLGIVEPKDRPWEKWDRPVQTYFVSGGRDWPEWMLGPPPGHPGCCAPPDMIANHRPREPSAA